MSGLHQSPNPRRSSSFPVQQRDGFVVVVLDGELDLVSAPRLKETVTKLLRAGHSRLGLDFSGVVFMDSTAISVLIAVHRRLGQDERLAIADVRPAVLKVFEVSGVAATFRIFPTIEAAVGYLTEPVGTESPPAWPPLTADAALSLGIASTAMPFAESEEDQVERWLRVLRRHGEAGAILASAGVSDARLPESQGEVGGAHHDVGGADPVAEVTEHAGRIASQRRATRTGTTDILLAAMHFYGATFDRVLAAHGADIEEVASRVATAHPAAA